MVEFGFYSLLLGFILSVYGFAMGAISSFKPVRGIVLSGKNALILVSVCVVISSLVLWYSIFSHDFSVRYAYRNSAIDMPIIYLFTAFWSSLEGSHLLWTMILSVISSIALLTVRPRNESLYPGLLVAFGFVQTFMLLLLVWASAPLTRQFPVGEFGRGMNALLQNPYMAAHPPCLFTGYSSLVVPFAYGIAAMVKGGFSPEWLVTVRRWTLWSWMILTIGIFLGGKWAYVELGWSGYWAWDPVENSSFMPWLAASAALHTLLIVDKTNRLPRLAVFLGVFAFALTFLGTFITRSGVISSVHSFAESDIGPAYLTYIVILLGISFALLGFRGHYLQGAARANTWVASKESALLFTNFFLLFLLALVLIGTLAPLIVEAVRGVKISIQQPFFNAFVPWVGLGLVAMLGVGNLARWRTGKIDDPIASILFPALWSIAITATLTIVKSLDVKSVIGYFFILWSAGSLIMDLVYKLRILKWNGRVFLKFNRPYLGSWIVHMGFLLAVAGFLGGYRGYEANSVLKPGESANFYGYTITNNGLGMKEGSNERRVYANLTTRDEKGNEFVVQPEKAKYSNSEQWYNEIGIYSTFWHDLYVVLDSFEIKDQEVSLKLHVNPTVKFVWTSLVIMVLGSLVGLTHRVLRRSIDVNSDGLELETATLSTESIASLPHKGKFFSIAIIMFAIGLTAFGFSPLALATENNVTQMDPKVKSIADALRCPTCQGLSVSDSDTPQSSAMKAEIEAQLKQGADKEDVLKFFKERYGEWILREPDRESSTGILIWLIPIIGLIAGPLMLVFGIRRSKFREISERQEIANQLKSYFEKEGVSL